MGIVIFIVLAAIAAGVIAYPLLPGRTSVQPAPAVTDREIERAVHNLRRTRSHGGLACPSCGKAYQSGDLFCVRCGGGLPEVNAQVESDDLVCPSCGTSLHEGDRFCAKCGHRVATEEVA
jgi:DNA-directed RNA polymerase subunit RPC12/RpoP